MDSSQIIVPIMPKFSLPFLADIPFFHIILVIFFIVYFGISVALVYHWTEYGMHSVKVIFAEILYILVSVALFAVSFIALSSI